ncbi:3-oxo-5-alpha-steroid 4-dehydrogenase 1-like protein, partial [Thalassiosira pseudonana CCMP1335]
NILLLSLFAMHYINRAIVYPLRMNPNCQPVPLVVTLSAMMVTTLNGYLQSFYLVNVEKENLQCWLGILIFFIGMGVNIHSDGVLRNLRRYGPSENKQQQQRTYYIPQSPLFAYISCPNFFGEILEWFGFSMASQFSLPSVAFFLYTASNLIPRGIAHHEWYLIKFEDYPKERRWAVVPFI